MSQPSEGPKTLPQGRVSFKKRLISALAFGCGIILITGLAAFMLRSFQSGGLQHQLIVSSTSSYRVPWIEEMKVFFERVKDPHSMDKYQQLYYDSFLSCWNCTNPLTFMQAECSLAYMYQVYKGNVSSVLHMKPVSLHGATKPGVALVFNNQVKGYWKACSFKQGWGPETYESELIAFHVGRVLEFSRTPVVVGRSFSHQEMVVSWPQYFNPDANAKSHHYTNQTVAEKLELVTQECTNEEDKSRGIVKGAVKAWMRHALIPWAIFDSELSKHSHFLSKPNHVLPFLDLSLSSTPFELMQSMERIRVICWMFLTGLFARTDHNLDVLSIPSSSGRPVVFVDNDRTTYSTLYPANQERGARKLMKKFFALCQFPAKLYQSLQGIYTRHSNLGEQVAYAMKYDPSGVRLLLKQEEETLSLRGEMLYKQMNYCIQKHGYQQVMYNDPADGDSPFSNIQEQYSLQKFSAVLQRKKN